MPVAPLHLFEQNGKRFAIDPETCFCFECDAISWDVLEHYPHTPINHILHLLENRHRAEELNEVIGELEWLRATKSILQTPDREKLQKKFTEPEEGLKHLVVSLPKEMPFDVNPFAQNAILLLLGRSGKQQELCFELVVSTPIRQPEIIAGWCAYAFDCARLAAKTMTISLRVTPLEPPKRPASLKGHLLSAVLELRDGADVSEEIFRFEKAVTQSLPHLAKAMQSHKATARGRIILQPTHSEYGEAVKTLHETGFNTIELDLISPYRNFSQSKPDFLFDGIRSAATYYAQCLSAHRYYRLEPVASLFLRIYNGTPQDRVDPAGTHELAIDEHGDIYPSPALQGLPEYCLGSILKGTFDEEKRKRFDDIGALTTPCCIRCWARNLCGGGYAAIHHALTGSFHTPQPSWCDAQRAWMASAIAAFEQLSSKGTQFARIYSVIHQSTKPSLFALARAAFRMHIGLRPIEEADAELLSRWENWNTSAYFLLNESGVLLATKYDREMDAIHPRGIEHELLLLNKKGIPFGLLKIRPQPEPGTAQAWIYFRSPEDYASESIRSSFRRLLKEAGEQQSIRRLTVSAASYEHELQKFLADSGFNQAGIFREGLYLHGQYHDVWVYEIHIDAL